MSRFSFKKILSILFVLPVFHTQSFGQGSGQTEQHFSKEITKVVELSYLIYLPENYQSSTDKFPLLLFLHGSGERGTDINLVKKHGPPMLVDSGKTFPFVIVSPQCPDNQWWDIDVVKLLLDQIITDYKIDSDRVYCTGLSMGGFATWALANKYPSTFAAIAPVCGGGNPLTIKLIGSLPVWAFHGAKDNVVLPIETERMVEALKNADGNAKMTIYPEANHNSWTATYNNPELYEWLLSWKKSDRIK